MYAAIKVGGRKLYEIARAGETIERAARAVRIDRLDLLEWEPPVATLLVECSKGTYIRALARDLGRALGTGGHLRALRRLRNGPFGLDHALTTDQLAAAFGTTPWERVALPPDAGLVDWPAIRLDEVGALAWWQGRPVCAPPDRPGERCRAYAPDGRWLGLGRYDPERDVWHPEKVVML
jgi:tRNA pseudouridine55 synthase